MRVRFSIPMCVHPPPPPPLFSSISSDPCSWLWPFLHPVQYFQEPNVSNHQKRLPTQNGINFSLVRPPHFRVREHIHTRWWASRAQCKPTPLWLSANKWLPAGWKKGMVRNVLNHFQLILLPSLFGTTWKGQFFHEVCGGGALRPPPGCDCTLISIYYPPRQHARLEDLAPDLLASRTR